MTMKVIMTNSLEGLEGPGHVLHVRPGEVELVYDPASQRSVDLAGPLGLLVVAPAAAGDVVVEGVVGPGEDHGGQGAGEVGPGDEYLH